MHYQRAYRAGTLSEYSNMGKVSSDPFERFWGMVHALGVCWEWTAYKNKPGYGKFTTHSSDKRRTVYAHRYAYEILVGPIPAKMTLDHLCKNPACVNPDHLEVVTLKENKRRASFLKQVCPAGHRYAEHVYIRKNGDRFCGKCSSERATRATRRRRAKAKGLDLEPQVA